MNGFLSSEFAFGSLRDEWIFIRGGGVTERIHPPLSSFVRTGPNGPALTKLSGLKKKQKKMASPLLEK
jgi:hypothetical protein